MIRKPKRLSNEFRRPVRVRRRTKAAVAQEDGPLSYVSANVSVPADHLLFALAAIITDHRFIFNNIKYKNVQQAILSRIHDTARLVPSKSRHALRHVGLFVRRCEPERVLSEVL